jgi:energy-coupling factor transporter transmembrane protein EcfT
MLKGFFVQKTSIVHDLDFWTKFLCFLLLLPLTAFISPASLLPLIAFMFITLFTLSKIGWQKFWQQTKMYHIPITIGIIILSLVFSPRMIYQRFFQGLVLATRFILLISFGVLFSMVTNPIEIPAGFLRAKLPHKYGVTLMVGYRMMPLISKKISTTINAQKARGADLRFSFKRLPKLVPQFAALMVPILHSTLETSVKLSDTLISRGYNPGGKITLPPGKLKKEDFTIFIISTTLSVITTLCK